MDTPRYVLLDQNHWIYLARAYYGKPRRPAHAAVVEKLLAAVASGAVRLPISSMHLIELLRAQDPARRRRLGEVFERFSGGWFIASWSQVLPGEIDRAVALALAQPSPPPPPEIFGRGFLYGIPLAARKQLLRCFSTDRWSIVEDIAAFPGATLDLVSSTDESARNRQNTSIAARNHIDAASLDKARLHFRTDSKLLHRRAKLARYTIDLQGHIIEALNSRGLAPGDFLSRGVNFLTSFWASVPSIHVDCELTLYRDRQWSRRIDPNDFVDLAHLALGVPYCAVVVTERFWGRAIIEAGLSRKHPGTVICTDLEDLATTISA